MFTKFSLSAFSLFFKMGITMFTLPFEWDSLTETMGVTKSRGRLWVWNLQFLFLIIVAGNTMLAFYNSILNSVGRSDPFRLTMDCTMGIGSSFILGFYVNFIRHKTRIAQLVTQFLKFNRELTEKYFGTAHPLKSDGFEFFVIIVLLILTFAPWVVISMFILDPDNPRFLYHHVPPCLKSNATYVLWLTIEWLIPVSYIAVFFLHMLIVLMISIGTNFWLRLLIPKAHQCHSNLAEGRLSWTPGSFPPHLNRASKMVIFSSLRVYNIVFNDCMSHFMWTSTIPIILLLQSMGIFGFVKFHDLLPIVVFLIFPLIFSGMLACEVFLFPLTGQINFYSTIFIRSLQPGGFLESASSLMEQRDWLVVKGGAQLVRRQVRAMRPLGASVAGVFVITPTTILVLHGLVSNITINLMLIYG